MIRKFIETMQNLLIILLNHLMLIGLGMIVMGMLEQGQSYIWLWSILAIVPMVLYFVRVKIKNFFLFFPIHLIFPVIVLVIPVQIVPKVAMVFIVLIYVIWSAYIRLRSENMREGLIKPVFVIGLLGVAAVADNLYSKMGLEWIYIALALVYIAGYFICNYIDQYFDFLTVNRNSLANIPEREILSSGLKQTFLFMMGSLVVLFLTANVGWLAYILSLLRTGVLSVLRYLLSLIADKNEEAEQILSEIEMLFDESDRDYSSLIDESFGEDKSKLGFTNFLDKNIVRIGGVIFAVLVVIAIVIGFMYYWKNYRNGSKEETGDEDLQTGIDIRETCTIEKNKKEASDLFAFLKPAERVRKIYRKQILKHKKEIIGENSPENLEYMTAEECCDKISSEDKASIKDLKFIYEKARYSAEEISSDDVKRMKLSI